MSAIMKIRKTSLAALVRGGAFPLMLLMVLVFGGKHLGAYPVYFTIQATTGTIPTCSNPNICDPLHVAGQNFTVSGKFDTTDTPASSGVNCVPSTSTNCNTYNISVTLIAPPSVLSFPVIVTAPVTITVNSGGNPGTFSTTLPPIPTFGNQITVAVTAGIRAGKIISPTPDGFGMATFISGNPPYTYGSVLSYVGLQGNSTQLTLTGTIDAINVLHAFTGTATDGGFPQSTLTEVVRGSFLGTTFGSGTLASTLFQIGANGTFSPFHTFNPPVEGTGAGGTLLEASNLMLYGADTSGGPSNTGVIFTSGVSPNSVTPVDTTVPAPFSLIQGVDGNLYGVTGSTTASNVFFNMPKATTTVGPTSLYTFTANDGIPSSPLIQANDGNFYGETTGGLGGSGLGMVYRLAKTSATTATLTPIHFFAGGANGQNPAGGLFQASNGLLYGAAAGGSGSGVVFSVNTSGTFFGISHTFTGADGAMPSGAVMQATDGNLYGTTAAGGATNQGTVFRLSLANVFSLLHNFSGPDGTQPQVNGPSLALGSDGRLYGTASASVNSDGSPGAGTVYSLNPKILVTKPKPAIVRFSPTSGPAGTAILVTGRYLLGLTGATLNGVAASFHSRGANYAVVVVPAAATGTGPITLTTVNGVANSGTKVFTVQ